MALGTVADKGDGCSIAEQILSDVDAVIERQQLKLYGNEIQKESRTGYIALCLGKISDGSKREMRVYNNGIIHDVDIDSSGHETISQLDNIGIAEEQIVEELLGSRRGIRKKIDVKSLTARKLEECLVILKKSKNT
ncbi:hypothetical protein KBB89_00420 [Candidatus Gracilibacteria bacterium]|nr:hypothetical protein [Candidatus Gracilibacteria bacterium]